MLQQVARVIETATNVISFSKPSFDPTMILPLVTGLTSSHRPILSLDSKRRSIACSARILTLLPLRSPRWPVKPCACGGKLRALGGDVEAGEANVYVQRMGEFRRMAGCSMCWGCLLFAKSTCIEDGRDPIQLSNV